MAKQRKLTPERKNLITQLLQEYKPDDVNGVQAMLKDLLGDTLQGVLGKFWGVDTIFENIASTFVMSVLFGPLTHILITREREIEKISRAYNQTTDIINSNDVDKFINSLGSIPIPHKKIISKLIIFEHFGYYLSDEQYSTMSNEILDEIFNWIYDNNRVFAKSRFSRKASKKLLFPIWNNHLCAKDL